ncbi:hypothetical protein O0L34_g18650 [Tuta absoluta]|nr:hypothetical protein O0L34_g18650 [Tuta absoluta]
MDDDIKELDMDNVAKREENDGRTPSPSVYFNEFMKEKPENDQFEKDYTGCPEFSGVEKVKRGREEDEEEGWQNVGKKVKQGKLEVYVACKTPFPKQFVLAKLLKEQGILEVSNMKYMSPYKLRIEFENVTCMEKAISCIKFNEMGWVFNLAYSTSYSYGIIRNVDLDLTEDDIKALIKCDSRAALSQVYRLKRRSEDGKWIPSETVRLCFKGSCLPSYVYVDNLRIKLEAYVFPVSQCSKCWKLGHTKSRCPSASLICPKCGGKHGNCITDKFTCVNCGGNHMALNKICPEFKKEKRIREIMSEFNCTYRKARTMFAPKTPDLEDLIQNDTKAFPKLPSDKNAGIENKGDQFCNNAFSPLLQYFPRKEKGSPAYAEVMEVKAQVHTDNSNSAMHKTFTSKEQRARKVLKTEKKTVDADTLFNTQDDKDYKEEEENTKAQRDVTFEDLLSRLKEVVFMKGLSFSDKITSVLKCCVEWLILVAVENIADWQVLQTLFKFING